MMRLLSNIKLPAKLEYLEQIIDNIADCAKKEGLHQKRVGEIQISTEEALVNIFNYAYEGVDGEVEINCKMENNEKFIVEIIDSGVPFDALSLKPPDVTAGISERGIGGLGVYLMKQLMDEVHYKRVGEKNILTLVISKTYNGNENPGRYGV